MKEVILVSHVKSSVTVRPRNLKLVTYSTVLLPIISSKWVVIGKFFTSACSGSHCKFSWCCCSPQDFLRGGLSGPGALLCLPWPVAPQEGGRTCFFSVSGSLQGHCTLRSTACNWPLDSSRHSTQSSSILLATSSEVKCFGLANALWFAPLLWNLSMACVLKIPQSAKIYAVSRS